MQGPTGEFSLSKFEGPTVTIKGIANRVDLADHSSSIASENSVACIEIPPGQAVPTLPDCHIIELRFDRYAILTPFKQGQLLSFVFSIVGEFVFVAPAPP